MLLGYAAAVAKGISIEEDVSRDCPTIRSCKNEKAEFFPRRDTRVKIIDGCVALATGANQLHTKIAGEMISKADHRAAVCVGLNVAQADAGVRNEINPQ